MLPTARIQLRENDEQFSETVEDLFDIAGDNDDYGNTVWSDQCQTSTLLIVMSCRLMHVCYEIIVDSVEPCV